MGVYLNPGTVKFEESLSSQICVDKSELIQYTNRVAGTRQKSICVSRPRRFGKSMAAEMLAAYYQRGLMHGNYFRSSGLQNVIPLMSI